MINTIERVKAWEEMVEFSDNLIIQALVHSIQSQISIISTGDFTTSQERISIVLLDQATELLMKAFLMKNGYKIEYFPKDVINSGLKEADCAGEERTIEFQPALSLVKRFLPTIDDKRIGKFHELRNKIYHSSLRIIENKRTAIDNFLPILEDFYKTAFPGRVFDHMSIATEIVI